jgi:hypothetical protein
MDEGLTHFQILSIIIGVLTLLAGAVYFYLRNESAIRNEREGRIERAIASLESRLSASPSPAELSRVRADVDGILQNGYVTRREHERLEERVSLLREKQVEVLGRLEDHERRLAMGYSDGGRSGE